MKGRVALITGAGRGIGREIALRLSSMGAVVAVCARGTQGIDSLRDEIAALGGTALAMRCDVGDEQDVGAFVEAASRITGTIDILVNNAGIARVGPLETLDTADWHDTIRINLTGPYLVTKLALPYLAPGSHIFNIGSNASKSGFPNWSAYCASKWGLLGFTNSIREELRPRGIRVTSILPGPTQTPIWDEIGGDWDLSGMMDPGAVADIVGQVYSQPRSMVTEEIFVMPAGGSL